MRPYLTPPHPLQIVEGISADSLQLKRLQEDKVALRVRSPLQQGGTGGYCHQPSIGYCHQPSIGYCHQPSIGSQESMAPFHHLTTPRT